MRQPAWLRLSALVVVTFAAVAVAAVLSRSPARPPIVQAEANAVAEPVAPLGEAALAAPAAPESPDTPTTPTTQGAATASPEPSDRAPAGTSPTTVNPTAAAAGATRGPATVRYPVLIASYTFVDQSRPTPGRADSRTLPVTVRYPNAAGSFPLVVFGHGFAASSGDYAALLTDLAAAGFVVAAPEFPLTSPAVTGYVNEMDVLNQPGDLSFVITRLLDESSRNGLLTGRIARSQVAVMGHSDGALTAAAVAYNSCCLDRRVGAAVLLSGEADGFGPVWFPVGSPPFLAVHGTADSVNAFGHSEAMFARAPTRRYLVSVLGGSHLGAFLSDSSRPQVVRVIADFLDAQLSADQQAADQLLRDGNVPGVLQLVSG